MCTFLPFLLNNTTKNDLVRQNNDWNYVRIRSIVSASRASEVKRNLKSNHRDTEVETEFSLSAPRKCIENSVENKHTDVKV